MGEFPSVDKPIKMATLRRAVLTAIRQTNECKLLSSRKLSSTAVVQANYWNHDWKPGAIPKTPEERAAAAKKYGIRPEDYKVLAEDGDDLYGRAVAHHLGDYPNLPIHAHSVRDPWEDYDHPQDKRNYGDLLHHDAEIPGNDWYDANKPGPGGLARNQVIFRFFAIFLGIWTAWYLLEPYHVFPPMMPKQYPFNNLYIEQGGDPDREPTVKHYKI